MIYRWEPVTGKPKSFTLDVDGRGRYYVTRRAPGSRQFVVLLNGRDIGGVWSDSYFAMQDIERELAAEVSA